jgi:hypothetical protein
MMARPFDRERKVPTPINWRRGLVRLWLLISAAWIMGWIIYYAIDFITGNWSSRELLAIPVVLFGPPAAILIMGMATRWAFRGFES